LSPSRGDGALSNSYNDSCPWPRDGYDVDVSPELISAITCAVLEAVGEWQGRPLDACNPLIFFGAIPFKIREEGIVRKQGCTTNGRAYPATDTST
jgi:hypothetical protein